MRLWHRALRRSGLPVRLSEGFHVRQRVSFALARGVGIASEAEWLEFELVDWVNPETVYRELAPQLPPALAIVELAVVAPSDRAVVRQVAYRVQLHGAPPDLSRRIEDLMARPQIVVQRGEPGRTRSLDVRPLLLRIEQRDGELLLLAESRNEGSVRPEEVLALLGLDERTIARSLITRAEARLADQQP